MNHTQKLLLAILIVFQVPVVAFSGECLETRRDMFDSFSEKITSKKFDGSLKNLDTYQLEKCWYHWDPKYQKNELSNKLGEKIVRLLNSDKIEKDLKLN